MRSARWILVSLSLGVAVGSFARPARAADKPPSAAPAPGATAVAAPAPRVVPAAAVSAPPPAPARPPEPAVAPAPASPPPATARSAPPKTFAPLREGSLSHALQFGIALLPGTGYRVIFPYQKENQGTVDCGQLNKAVCTSRLPIYLDVQPSFGFAKHWDVLADLRFGLGQDFTRSRQFAIAPGVRYWVDPEDHAKFFATIQIAYDTTDQNNTMLRNNDFALRNSNGFMYEIMRNFGAYIQFGETLGFVRWLRFEIDVGIGVQARLP